MNYTRHFECGCKVIVIGELTNAKIHYCPKHEAAPEMYEALKMAGKLLQEQYEILLGVYPKYGTIPELGAVNLALAKVEGKNGY